LTALGSAVAHSSKIFAATAMILLQLTILETHNSISQAVNKLSSYLMV
jgi:hypothetical protein